MVIGFLRFEVEVYWDIFAMSFKVVIKNKKKIEIEFDFRD